MNKTALITGATSGIGWATALLFAQNNINLIICGRNKNKLNELESIVKSMVSVTQLCFDVSKNEEVVAAINSLPKECRNIDILVNNAGNAHGLSSFENGDIEDWNAMMNSNVMGVLYVTKAVVNNMIERKTGHIINISSVAGKYTYANGVVYCASKKAVEAISEGLRLDLTQHNIKITNIAPGAVQTNFSLVRFKGDEERAKKVYEGFDPLTAENIAASILYAIQAPANVTIADMTIYASAQAAPTTIYRK